MGAWIEIAGRFDFGDWGNVAPLVGAWIEIPQRQRSRCDKSVAPLVGAWIEILNTGTTSMIVNVAPLVGAWIEMQIRCFAVTIKIQSLLSWERGLKLFPPWSNNSQGRRSSRGSVD